MAGSLVLNFAPRDGPLLNHDCREDVESYLKMLYDYDNVNVEVMDFKERLQYALRKDNQDEFVELINTAPSDLSDDVLEDTTLEEMFDYSAVKCAEAVFCRPTKICNSAFLMSKCFATPLHEAARHLNCSITALLLQRGFSAEDRCEWSINKETDLYGKCHLGNPRLLPLGVALLKLRGMMLRWRYTSPISAKYFIVHLFDKKYHLEGLRLLAENTKEVKQEFYNYLVDGKMIEVGALLLVAKSRILSPSSSKVEGEFRSISEMYDFLLDAKRHLSVSADASLLEKNKWLEMEQTLLLLQIFDRIGDKLRTLSRLDFSPISVNYFPNLAAASLLEDAGFDVIAEDVRFVDVFPISSDWSNAGENNIKKDITTCALPYWLKEEPSSVLPDKSTALLEGNRVSLSAWASTSSAPEFMSLQHLLKSSAPLVGSFKRFLRR